MAAPVNNPRPFEKLNIDDVISKLSSAEKVALLAGLDMWHSTPISRLGIPSLRMSDGPNGVRGTRFYEGIPSSCFPAATGLGASFDTELVTRIGRALGVEAKAKGTHILLGPTINIQRSPLGGRGFESYSEDPLLSGLLARAYITGLQEEGVAATPKHYVANDQEFERMSMSSEVSARALREIYLRPFELCVRPSLTSSPPWALMTSYNRLSGLHCSENPFLLTQVLREEWGWKGMVMSDWFGTYSASESVRAGLDIEMPGPAVARGAVLSRALSAQKVFEHDLNNRVRNILQLVNEVQSSGVPEDANEELVDTPEVRSLLREAADAGVVLLKNEGNVLPFAPTNPTYASKPIKSIALIGPDAKAAVISGGGSAALRPSYTVTPFDAVVEVAKEIFKGQDIKVEYARGGNAHKWAPLFGPELKRKDGKPGVDCYWYNVDPLKNTDAKPVLFSTSATTNMFLQDGLDLSTGLAINCWAELKGTFTPEATSKYEFGLASCGFADLYVNGKKIIDNSTNPIPGELFFNTGSLEETGIIELTANTAYEVLVRYQYQSRQGQMAGTITPNHRGGVRFGVAPAKTPEEFIAEAVEVAKGVDAVVLVVGLNGDFESEAYDRSHMNLPGNSDALAAAVVKANPHTAVVVQSGTPIEMPWARSAPAIVQAFYGGNAVGYGIADVVLGKVNPSSRLPLSFPIRLEDNPSYLNFPGENGKVYYGEGIFVGYRHYQATKKPVLFPFGAGLSYTQFRYSDAKISSKTIAPNGEVTVSVTIANIGKLPGREVVQFYVHDVASSLQRPPQELKAFAKTKLLEPGASETVTVTLDRISLAFFDDHLDVGRWVAEAGAFEVRVGPTSEKIEATLPLELTETFSWI
ncbi:putative beta-glucosidase precursor [Clavulina sp. PMI_390]|nr:putative beta-glucosidase precursor [Clavulina sp. PMI_390]